MLIQLEGKLAVNIDQKTMDDLTQGKDKIQQKLTNAQQTVIANQAQVTTLQKQLDSYNALIADSVVVP
jgi:hypothetical protein